MGCHSSIFAIYFNQPAIGESIIFITKETCCYYGRCYDKSGGFSSPSSLFLFFYFAWLMYSLGVMCKSMVVKDTLEVIEFVLGEEDLTSIQEEFSILVLVRLELSGPSERMTMGSMIRMALHEDAFKARLRLPLPAIITKLLRWYQVCPT